MPGILQEICRGSLDGALQPPEDRLDLTDSARIAELRWRPDG